MKQTRVVVVGAGSAGCVLAARLSEDPAVVVTLLEAGPDPWPDPAADEVRGSSFVRAMALPEHYWPLLEASRVAGDTPRLYRRGRGVGGSSAINAMVALPGEPADYDAWERQHGCAGWGWADVAPWFSRTLLSLHTASADEWGPVARAAARVWPQCSDGVALTRTAAGRRVSVADCYLDPVRSRPNLVVRGDALVERVLLTGRRAVGVRLVDGGEIDADLVIISAGAVHSPAMLLRSAVDVAGVGENLHDHPSVAVALDLCEPADTWSLSIATVVQLSREPGDHDLQVVPMEYVDASLPQLGVLMGAVMRVHSRGSVCLASDDPTVDPLVNFNMLSDERDVTGMHAVADALEAAAGSAAMRLVGSPVPFDRTDAGLRAAAGDYVHAAGTCSMGTVVDSMCRVQRYENLMVCDASVMPSLPRANTHLPTVMIAERIASITRARLSELAGDS
ncbi:MAG: hypothetical protein RLZZ623_2029 [Actinomycetota bacterium]